MHIEPTTHEHGLTAKVYNYEGDFDVGDDAITWNAKVRHGQDVPRVITGTIPISSPAMAALADKAVRDAIVKTIDADGALKTQAQAQAPAAPLAPPVRSQLHDALDRGDAVRLQVVGQRRLSGERRGRHDDLAGRAG